MYLHIPHLIEDKTLKWFSIGILKIVDLIRNKIINAAVFEEVKINFYEIKIFKLNLKNKKPKKEDFHSMDYNFKFANDITEQTCVSSLKIVEDEASKYYRVRKKEREREGIFKFFILLFKNVKNQQSSNDNKIQVNIFIHFLFSSYKTLVL